MHCEVLGIGGKEWKQQLECVCSLPLSDLGKSYSLNWCVSVFLATSQLSGLLCTLITEQLPASAIQLRFQKISVAPPQPMRISPAFN